MRMSQWVVFAAFWGVLLTLVFPACGRKKEAIPKIEQAKIVAIDGLMKDASLTLYPGTELLDQSVKSDKTQVPGTDKPDVVQEIVVGMVLGVSGEDFEKVRGFYATQAPHIITEEKVDGIVRFLQLSNVSDINKAIGEKTSPILLINLRRRILAEGERLAYQNEYQTLKASKALDAVQGRRITELERLLQEKTFIQLNIRKLS